MLIYSNKFEADWVAVTLRALAIVELRNTSCLAEREDTRFTLASGTSPASMALHRAAQPWRPSARLAPDARTVRHDGWRQKMCSILNRLTPDNFVRLVAQACSLPMRSSIDMTAVALMILDKAATEPLFSATYAGLCRALANRMPGDVSVPSKTFGDLLSLVCTTEFGDAFGRQQQRTLLSSCREREESADERLARRRLLGILTFAAELCKLQLLSDTWASDAVVSLLNRGTEASTECLCCFLTHVGHYLENVSQPLVHRCIETFYSIVEEKKSSLRLRCLLMNVVEMKQRGWQRRCVEAGPRTLAQVRQEAASEDLMTTFATTQIIPRHSHTGRQ